jgi:hypothetical protein
MAGHPFLLLVVTLVSFLCPVKSVFWPFGKVGLQCERETIDNVECMAGGVFNVGGVFSGTYMCREKRSWLFFKRNETVCVPTLANGVIGEIGDQCGCCGGECPKTCTCVCSHDKNYQVLLYKDELFGRKSTHCVSQGKASRWVGNGEYTGYSCVPDDECPTMEPTQSPTREPFLPTD